MLAQVFAVVQRFTKEHICHCKKTIMNLRGLIGLWNNQSVRFLPPCPQDRKCAPAPVRGSTFPLRETGKTGSHQAAFLLSATSQGNMKTEIQVVCCSFVWDLGAVVRGKPFANLQTKELPVLFLLQTVICILLQPCSYCTPKTFSRFLSICDILGCYKQVKSILSIQPSITKFPQGAFTIYDEMGFRSGVKGLNRVRLSDVCREVIWTKIAKGPAAS